MAISNASSATSERSDDATADTQFAHQPGHPVAAHRDTLASQFGPQLLHPVDLEVLLEHPDHLDLEQRVTTRPSRRRPALGRGIRRRGELQHPAARLAPPTQTVGHPVPGYR